MSIDQAPNQGKPSENSVPHAIAPNDFNEEEKQKITKQIGAEIMKLALNEFEATEGKFIEDLEAAGIIADHLRKNYLSTGNNNAGSFTPEGEEKLYRVFYALKEMHKLKSLQGDFFKALFDPSEGYLKNPDQTKAKKLMEQYDKLGAEEGKLCTYYEEEQILEIVIPAAVNQDKAVRDQVENLTIQSLLSKVFQHFLKIQLKLNEVTKSMPQTDERLPAMQELNEKVRKMQSSVNAEIKKKEIPTGDIKITLKFDGENGKHNAINKMMQAKAFLTKVLEAKVKSTEMAEKQPIGLTMPVGYTISGEKTSFTVKKGIIPIWEIKISGSSLSIQELSRGDISKEDNLRQLELMDQFTHYLNIHLRGSLELSCPNLDKVRILNGLSVYQIGRKEKRALLVHAEALKKQTGQTVDKRLKDVELLVTLPATRPNDNIIRGTFQEHMDNGFIPHTAELGKYGKFSGELEIKTTNPALAIKQAEAALEVGFDFTFSDSTKKQIQTYVREEVKAGVESGKVAKQINISEIEPESVLNSVLEVANNGLIANLDASAEQSLRKLFAQQKDFPDAKYNIPPVQPDTLTALQFREMAQRGFLPTISDKKELTGFRQKMSRVEGKISESFVINSGNTVRDIQVLQFATELGVDAQVSAPEQVCQSASQMENPPSIDLTNMSPDLQRKQIAYFAGMGLNAIVSKSVVKKSIEIETLNGAHAAALYASYLDQGFEPHFKKNAKVAMIKELISRKVEIDLKNQKDPVVLLNKLNKIIAQGFSPVLDESQRQILRQHIAKQRITSPLIISGYRSDVAWSNQELAYDLGLEAIFDGAALFSFAKDQQRHKEQKEPLPQKEMQAVKDKKGKVDIEKTFERAERVLATGYAVTLPKELNDMLANMAEMTVGQKDKKKMKVAQVKALKWVERGNQFINKNEANKAQFNEGVHIGKLLKMQAIEMFPIMKQTGGFLGLGSKSQIDKDATLRLARSFSQQGFSLILPKALEGILLSLDEVDNLNKESQAYAQKWQAAMQEASQVMREAPLSEISVRGEHRLEEDNDFDEDEWDEDLEAENPAAAVQKQPVEAVIQPEPQLPPEAVIENRLKRQAPLPPVEAVIQPEPQLPPEAVIQNRLKRQAPLPPNQAVVPPPPPPPTMMAPPVAAAPAAKAETTRPDSSVLMDAIRKRGGVEGGGLKHVETNNQVSPPKANAGVQQLVNNSKVQAMIKKVKENSEHHHDQTVDENDNEWGETEDKSAALVKRSISNDSAIGSLQESDNENSPIGRPEQITFFGKSKKENQHKELPVVPVDLERNNKPRR